MKTATEFVVPRVPVLRFDGFYDGVELEMKSAAVSEAGESP